MKKVISICLSLLLLLSSTGITYAQHFCGEHEMMAKVTLGQEVLSCGMAMTHDDGCADESTEEHGCCDNKYTQVDVDDNFADVSFDVQLDPVFVASFVSIFVLKETTSFKKEHDYFKDYSPPPLEEDFCVLYDTFLI
ncbi:hypothetical protein POV27_03280 [Aureisphaera galaxeae]|uniref:HYC_CC_PP family protein n=1 Tax=Aureisphaera galaxeae TaxID=1538023 RepID=UPI00235098F4|nr:hypothetical protein [Aureisphaera galaxeae]MDC8003056.1 hypothetical protein [Aureisphaera galaxeae]